MFRKLCFHSGVFPSIYYTHKLNKDFVYLYQRLVIKNDFILSNVFKLNITAVQMTCVPTNFLYINQNIFCYIPVFILVSTVSHNLFKFMNKFRRVFKFLIVKFIYKDNDRMCTDWILG